DDLRGQHTELGSGQHADRIGTMRSLRAGTTPSGRSVLHPARSCRTRLSVPLAQPVLARYAPPPQGLARRPTAKAAKFAKKNNYFCFFTLRSLRSFAVSPPLSSRTPLTTATVYVSTRISLIPLRLVTSLRASPAKPIRQNELSRYQSLGRALQNSYTG